MQIDLGALKMIVNERLLVRVLMIIGEAEGYSTRKLLKRLGSNELHPLLTRAEKDGYIRRDERKPEGKGNHMICNYLTKKGKALVDIARQVQ